MPQKQYNKSDYAYIKVQNSPKKDESSLSFVNFFNGKFGSTTLWNLKIDSKNSISFFVAEKFIDWNDLDSNMSKISFSYVSELGTDQKIIKYRTYNSQSKKNEDKEMSLTEFVKLLNSKGVRTLAK